eukprot:TRINITY_DN3115_c0_g1_i1.p1 TRINITY_DN3115_c0_g1~~TRINITY_DN3115_c0_g1_i1.p1  ORF type:complete len:385 (+),score=103.35 TRINITY_DN3115_c0_g1_i1:44-1156(+)
MQLLTGASVLALCVATPFPDESPRLAELFKAAEPERILDDVGAAPPRAYSDMYTLPGSAMVMDANGVPGFPPIPSVGLYRSFYEEADGVPMAVGLQFGGVDVLNADKMQMAPTVAESLHYAPVPREAKVPFQTITISAARFGHPGDFAAVPHYDVHFFMIPPLDVTNIPSTKLACVPPAGPQDLGTNFLCMSDPATAPAPDPVTGFPRPGPWGVECLDCAYEKQYKALPCTLPAGYVPWVAVPANGMHLVPANSPAFPDGAPGCEDDADGVNGWSRKDACFKHMPLLGSYNGELVFYEPMITLEALGAVPVGGDKQCQTFGVPDDAVYTRAGWYPANYCWAHPAENVYEISVTDFTYHDYATECPAPPAA